jgi:hypothetical protein
MGSPLPLGKLRVFIGSPTFEFLAVNCNFCRQFCVIIHSPGPTVIQWGHMCLVYGKKGCISMWQVEWHFDRTSRLVFWRNSLTGISLWHIDVASLLLSHLHHAPHCDLLQYPTLHLSQSFLRRLPGLSWLALDWIATGSSINRLRGSYLSVPQQCVPHANQAVYCTYSPSWSGSGPWAAIFLSETSAAGFVVTQMAHVNLTGWKPSTMLSR